MHERHLTQRVQVDVVALRFFTPSVTHHQQIITEQIISTRRIELYMPSLSERWYGRFHEDQQDLGITRALLTGLLTTGLYLVLFVLLLALALGSSPNEQIGAQASAIGYLAATVGGLILGARPVYRFYTSDQARERAQRFPIRVPMMIAFVVLYYLLARYRPTYAVWLGICYVVARALTHLGIYIAARA